MCPHILLQHASSFAQFLPKDAMSEDFSTNTPIRPSISRSSSFSSLRFGMERYGEELSSEGLILLGVYLCALDVSMGTVTDDLNQMSWRPSSVSFAPAFLIACRTS